MLNKSLALLILAQCLNGSATAANYVLRVESIKRVDSSIATAAPKETVVHSTEIVCRPDLPAHCTTQINNETVTLSAVLHLAEHDTFTITLEYSDSVDNGETIPDGKGGRQKNPAVQLMRTTVTVPKNQPVEMAWFTESEGDGKVERTTTTVNNVIVREYHPSDENGATRTNIPTLRASLPRQQLVRF